jgi:hypothetical protein
MSPRVFIVQRPTQRDGATGAVVPSMDLSPANEWGNPMFILRDSENPFFDTQSTVLQIEQFLEREGFDAEDFLLLVGNPVLIGLVSAVAASFTTTLNFLQWSKADHGYRPVTAQLSE